MSDPKYKHIGTPLIRVIEECSEVIQAGCKIERFGWYNFNPYDKLKTTNLQRLESEIKDLKDSIEELEILMNELKIKETTLNA